MKRNILIMCIALAMLYAVTAIVFAETNVSFTANSVTVRNTVNGRISLVEVCVTFQDSRGVKSEQTWTFRNVTRTAQTQNAPDGLRIIDAFSTFCAVPVTD